MDNVTFSVTLIIVGMGGTVLALALFSMLMTLLKALFPLKPEASEKESA